MSDNVEFQSKLLGFLMGEWARKDNRQLVAVELLYAPGNGFKDESIRKWVRADEPELFAEFVNIEKLVTQILEIAEGEADAKQAGKHRFVVRTHQHCGEKQSTSVSMSPSYRGSDDVAILPAGGVPRGGDSVAVAQILASNNGQLMRINTQMFDGAIRVLGQQNMSLHEQVAALTGENAMLRRELEEARSNKMDREFQIAMAAEKNARTNAGFQKLLQIGSVVAAKIGASAQLAGAEGTAPAASPLASLIGDFYQSLRPDQMTALMQTLEIGQKMMFMEIVNLVRPPEPRGGGNAAAGTNGAPQPGPAQP